MLREKIAVVPSLSIAFRPYQVAFLCGLVCITVASRLHGSIFDAEYPGKILIRTGLWPLAAYFLFRFLPVEDEEPLSAGLPIAVSVQVDHAAG